jgi:hypothetical protein
MLCWVLEKGISWTHPVHVGWIVKAHWKVFKVWETEVSNDVVLGVGEGISWTPPVLALAGLWKLIKKYLKYVGDETYFEGSKTLYENHAKQTIRSRPQSNHATYPHAGIMGPQATALSIGLVKSNRSWIVIAGKVVISTLLASSGTGQQSSMSSSAAAWTRRTRLRASKRCPYVGFA